MEARGEFTLAVEPQRRQLRHQPLRVEAKFFIAADAELPGAVDQPVQQIVHLHPLGLVFRQQVRMRSAVLLTGMKLWVPGNVWLQ